MIFDNKKAVSPLVATLLLIVFSLILGTVTMNLGKAYIEEATQIGAQAGEESLKYIGDTLYECRNFDENQKCTSWQILES